MAKEMVRDDYGYINNRGISKYWGVTVSKVDGKDIWVVNFKPRWAGGVTCGYRPANGSFKLKEQDAAKIAAFLYDDGESYPVNEKVRILSVDRKYVFVFELNDTKIYRERYTNQKVWNRPILTLDLLDQEPSKEVVEEMLKSLDDDTQDERAIVRMVTEAVLDGRIGKTGALLLIGALEQAVV